MAQRGGGVNLPSEYKLIKKTIIPLVKSDVALGDDCGWIDIGKGYVLISSIDSMNEGIHYKPRWMSFASLARKIFRVSVSDIAAMGAGEDVSIVVAMGLTRGTNKRDIAAFAANLRNEAARFSVKVLGGDITESQNGNFVSASVTAKARKKNLLLRSSARPGEIVWLTGPVGLAGAGLDVLESNNKRRYKFLARTHLLPVLRLREGRLISNSGISRCAMDLSDSLAASLFWVSSMSGVSIEADLSIVKKHKALIDWCKQGKRNLQNYLLYGGEDYELLFTSHPRYSSRIRRSLPGAYPIGHVKDRPKTPLVYVKGIDGERILIDEDSMGYQAFNGEVRGKRLEVRSKK
ncbi:thiamine-phosphate kinase [Elusimicrobiota bacterium]